MGGRRSTRRPVYAVKKSRVSINFVFVLFLLIGFSLFHLYMRNSIRAMLLEIANLEKQVNSLVDENRRLQAKMIRLSANDRIHRIAVERLQMVDPVSPPKLVYYRRDARDADADLLAESLSPEEMAFMNPNALIHSVGE